MPSTSNHPHPSTLKCPLCNKYPEKKVTEGSYEYFSCKCGRASSGWVTSDAVGNWNYLVEERGRELQYEIAKKLLDDDDKGQQALDLWKLWFQENEDPWVPWEGESGLLECYFCHKTEPNHELSCIYLAAKELVVEKPEAADA